MPLTDLAILQAQPQEKSYTLADSHHLSLFVAAHGTKSWHFRFSWQCKQYRISLGTYPQISLYEERKLQDNIFFSGLKHLIPICTLLLNVSLVAL